MSVTVSGPSLTLIVAVISQVARATCFGCTAVSCRETHQPWAVTAVTLPELRPLGQPLLYHTLLLFFQYIHQSVRPGFSASDNQSYDQKEKKIAPGFYHLKPKANPKPNQTKRRKTAPTECFLYVLHALYLYASKQMVPVNVAILLVEASSFCGTTALRGFRVPYTFVKCLDTVWQQVQS